MSIWSIFGDILYEQALIKEKNKEKVQQAKDKYWEACKLPRKLKKKERKIALVDYNFWLSLGEFHNNMFNFN